jgi:hypothetical protein
MFSNSQLAALVSGTNQLSDLSGIMPDTHEENCKTGLSGYL